MRDVLTDPIFMMMVSIVCVTILVGIGISKSGEPDLDMKACVEAGGSYIDASNGDLCLIGLAVK